MNDALIVAVLVLVIGQIIYTVYKLGVIEGKVESICGRQDRFDTRLTKVEDKQ